MVLPPFNWEDTIMAEHHTILWVGGGGGTLHNLEGRVQLLLKSSSMYTTNPRWVSVDPLRWCCLLVTSRSWECAVDLWCQWERSAPAPESHRRWRLSTPRLRTAWTNCVQSAHCSNSVVSTHNNHHFMFIHYSSTIQFYSFSFLRCEVLYFKPFVSFDRYSCFYFY